MLRNRRDYYKYHRDLCGGSVRFLSGSSSSSSCAVSSPVVGVIPVVESEGCGGGDLVTKKGREKEKEKGMGKEEKEKEILVKAGKGRKGSNALFKQWKAIRDEWSQKGFLLLFQVGDFYEFYNQDAFEISKITGLKVARKSVATHSAGAERVGEKERGVGGVERHRDVVVSEHMDFSEVDRHYFMAGFPREQLNDWIPRLVLGHSYRIAICDQIDDVFAATEAAVDPVASAAKSKLKNRVISKAFSPGTIVNELEPQQANFLLALACHGTPDKDGETMIGMSWTDVATGQYRVSHVPLKEMGLEISRIGPSEILVESDCFIQAEDSIDGSKVHISELPYFTDRKEQFFFTFWDVDVKSCGKSWSKENKDGDIKWNEQGIVRSEDDLSRGLKAAYSRGFINGAWDSKDDEFLALVSEMSSDERKSSLLLFEYVNMMRNGSKSFDFSINLNKPSFYRFSEHMQIDPETCKNLEIYKAKNSGSARSLCKVMEQHLLTNIGKRALKELLLNPFLDAGELNRRYDLVDFFFHMKGEPQGYLKDISEYLRGCVDLERIMLTGVYESKSLDQISETLESAVSIDKKIKEYCESSNVACPSIYFKRCSNDNLPSITHTSVTHELDWISKMHIIEYLKDCSKAFYVIEEYEKNEKLLDFPQFSSENRSHTHFSVLERLGDAYSNLLNVKKKLDAKEQCLSDDYEKRLDNWSRVKVKVVRLVDKGLMVAVPSSFWTQLEKEEKKEFMEELGLTYRDRTGAVVRFKTECIVSLEEELVAKDEELQIFKKRVWEDIRNRFISRRKELFVLQDFILATDISSGFASLAFEDNYCRPSVTNDMFQVTNIDGNVEDERCFFEVCNGRHPVLDSIHQGSEKHYLVPNDCHMTKEHTWIVTGPNMGGKSTFLRQNALLAVMAQVGSFVPADSMHMTIVDKVYGRIGASDNITRGQSTFMVEMLDLARILNAATRRSFVVLDELGRGTSVNDGSALARACIEYLTEKLKCRTLMSTHFHNMDCMSVEGVAYHCVTMENVYQESLSEASVGDGLVANETMFDLATKRSQFYPYRLQRGYEKNSFGIQVARMAGVPKSVILRAMELNPYVNDASNRSLLDVHGSADALDPVQASETVKEGRADEQVSINASSLPFKSDDSPQLSLMKSVSNNGLFDLPLRQFVALLDVEYQQRRVNGEENRPGNISTGGSLFSKDQQEFLNQLMKVLVRIELSGAGNNKQKN
eukprot:Nk52_evm13s294 gene=Nk52_evmTU13s294